LGEWVIEPIERQSVFEIAQSLNHSITRSLNKSDGSITRWPDHPIGMADLGGKIGASLEGRGIGT
jgi:hypothetical protein